MNDSQPITCTPPNKTVKKSSYGRRHDSNQLQCYSFHDPPRGDESPNRSDQSKFGHASSVDNQNMGGLKDNLSQ